MHDCSACRIITTVENGAYLQKLGLYSNENSQNY